MIHAKYMAKKRAYINGKLYNPGDVLSHYPGLENRKSFRGIGEPITNNEKIDNDEEDTNEDEIKRGFRGSWKLPNGDVFTGKRAEAKEHWEQIKNK